MGEGVAADPVHDASIGGDQQRAWRLPRREAYLRRQRHPFIGGEQLLRHIEQLQPASLRAPPPPQLHPLHCSHASNRPARAAFCRCLRHRAIGQVV
eukprot:1580701-Pleurochrysis_carterae.AAC.2